MIALEVLNILSEALLLLVGGALPILLGMVVAAAVIGGRLGESGRLGPVGLTDGQLGHRRQ